MPNHIKNRITLIGSQEQVNATIEAFSTHYPRSEHKAYDGDLIFLHKDDNNLVGWLNPETNIFKRRNEPDYIGIPKGFEQDYVEAWTRFPDFERVIPMPEGLDISSDNWVMPLENKFSSGTPLKEHLDRMREVFEKSPEMTSGTLENFIQGIRNYIQHGHATWHGWSCKNWGTKWNSYSCEKIDENVYEFNTAWSGVPGLVRVMSEMFPLVKFEYEYSDEDTGSNCGYATFVNGKGDIVRLASQSKEAYELAFKLRPSNAQYYQLVDGKYQYVDEDD